MNCKTNQYQCPVKGNICLYDFYSSPYSCHFQNAEQIVIRQHLDSYFKTTHLETDHELSFQKAASVLSFGTYTQK